jgi:hypothetical protein
MSEDFKDLTVQIDAITVFENSTSSSLLPEAIPAFIDSSFPYIWLPPQACLLFEQAFGLTFDNVTELYLVNDSLHDALMLQNATLVFTLGDPVGSIVNITFPYAAFDLTASSPLVSNTTRYFPLKRAANSTQFTLGRTFFQEAYVVANYEQGNFSVFQRSWAKSDAILVAIPSIWLSPQKSFVIYEVVGTIAGVVGFALAGGLIYFCYVRKSRRSRVAKPATLTSEVDHKWYKPELHGDDIQPAQELEVERNRWVEEAEANEVQIFELPAREEVAAELGSPHEGIEFPTSEATTLAEDEASPQRQHENPRDVSLSVANTRTANSGPVSPQSQHGSCSEVSSPVGEILDEVSKPINPRTEAPGDLSKSLQHLLSWLSK